MKRWNLRTCGRSLSTLIGSRMPPNAASIINAPLCVSGGQHQQKRGAATSNPGSPTGTAEMVTPYAPPSDLTAGFQAFSREWKSRGWVVEAVRKVSADGSRSADTHLHKIRAPGLFPNIPIYLKDESTHPTGSLKHRLARSLFMYALVNGWIDKGTTIIESSSGSTAISEAYFATLLGLPFIAVMPSTTSRKKIENIEFWGGKCHLVDPPKTIYEESRRLAKELKGHYMDQFTFAERATDWRGQNSVAVSIFEQMREEIMPIPAWIIVGAGTGGTAATLGRFARYGRHKTRICVVDPENSVFYDYYKTGNKGLTSNKPSMIEGIGRPQVEASFTPEIIDKMMNVPDAASIAAMRFLYKVSGLMGGASTGTNFYGVMRLAAEMKWRGEDGPIVSLVCDSGLRYMDKYYSDEWMKEHKYDIEPYTRQIEHCWKTGSWKELHEL
jgi:cysteine synthase A